VSNLNLNNAVSRFNTGCDQLTSAVNALDDRNFGDYENRLNSAGGNVIGALEWALKTYLRQNCRPRLTDQDYARLHRPNFNDLIDLLGRYAVPAIAESKLTSFEEYRRSIRNSGEHDATVPSVETLDDAIRDVRNFLIIYLGVDAGILSRASISNTGVPLSELKKKYYESIASHFEYLDLRGVSPRVGNKVIRIKMEDVFVPPLGIESVSLLESFDDDLGRSDTERFSPSSWSDVEWDDIGLPPGLSMEARSKPSTRTTDLYKLLQEPRLVLLGDPGSGKTTFGRHIALSIACSDQTDFGNALNGRTPILIRASDYGALLSEEPSLSLFDYIVDRHSSKYSQLFRMAVHTGKALIIIDGLDEVAEPRSRVLSSRRIEEFVSEFADNHFVVTSRLIGYRQNQLSGSFKEIQLAPFDPDQVLAFLTKWHQAVDQVSNAVGGDEEAIRRATELWNAIRESPGTRRLATNPLLLTIIALVSWRGTKLPNRRVELYQIATETLLENWPLRQRGQDLRAYELLSILEPVAFEIFTSGHANAISEFDLRPIVERKVCEVQGVASTEAQSLSREVLEKIEKHTGFFVERGTDQSGRSIYGFLHLTFAEYLAGRYLSEQWSTSPAILDPYAHDPRWREVILLMAGHVGTWAVAQISKLVTDTLRLSSPYEEYIHRDLLLAASMLADNARVKREVQDLVVGQLIEIVLADICSGMAANAQYLLKTISQVTPLGSIATSIEPSMTDEIEVRVTKAALCLSLDHAVESSTKILAEIMVDGSVPSSLRFDAAYELLGTAGMARGDMVVGYFSDGLQFAMSAGSAIMERLKYIPHVVATNEHFDGSTKSCILVISTEYLMSLEARQIAEIVLEMQEDGFSLLLVALSMADLGSNVCSELFAIGLSNNVDVGTRTTALRRAMYLVRDGMRDRLEGSDELSNWSQSLKDLALSGPDADLRTEAALAYVLLSEKGPNTASLLLFTQSLVKNAKAKNKSRLIDLMREDILPLGQWESEEERMAATAESNVGAELRRYLGDPDPQVRRASAFAMVSARLSSASDTEAVLAAMHAGTPEENELLRILQSYSGLLMDSDADDVTRVIAADLCDFVASWESSREQTEVDELAELLSYSPFSRKSAVVGKQSRIVDAAIEELIASPDAATRMRGVLLWRRFSSPQSSPVSLLNLLKDDPEASAYIWRGLPDRAAINVELIEVGLRAISSDSKSLSAAAASALAACQEESLRTVIVDHVLALLKHQPMNGSGVSILWNFFGPSRWRMNDFVPF
jgi:hypothetical protein